VKAQKTPASLSSWPRPGRKGGGPYAQDSRGHGIVIKRAGAEPARRTAARNKIRSSMMRRAIFVPASWGARIFHCYLRGTAFALLRRSSISIISRAPSLGLVSGLVESRLAHATLWSCVPLIEGWSKP